VGVVGSGDYSHRLGLSECEWGVGSFSGRQTGTTE
jgi:hypothetical protein